MACVNVSEKGTESVCEHICGSRLREWIFHATCKHTDITHTHAGEFRKLGMLLEQAGRVDMSVMRDEIDRVIAVSSLASSLAHADESLLSHEGIEVPHTAAAPRTYPRARTATAPGERLKVPAGLERFDSRGTEPFESFENQLQFLQNLLKF